MENKRKLPAANIGPFVREDEVIGMLDRLAGVIEELTPHLDHILSDAVTANQRRIFRDQAGKARTFDLSNNIHRFNQRMNALCSETARRIAIEKHSLNSRRP
jgi:hypothetical protein